MHQHLRFALVALLTAAITPALALAQRPTAANATVTCPLILDGRVPSDFSLTSFNTANKVFNPDYVKGQNLQWSDILLLPDGLLPSRFDEASKTKAVEVTIDDRSIFNPGGTPQKGFRRAGLQFVSDSANDASDVGVKTLHFSVRQDGGRGFNLSHEYLLVWHETADYSANQFNFEAGTIIGGSAGNKDSYKLLGRNNQLIWSTPINYKDWQNFAITIDYNKNTLRVYYSLGASTPLASVTSAVSNNNAGAGQFQMGVLKKPTGTSDVVNSGFQSKGIHEGLVYGGLFVEDSASNGCVSL